MTIMISDHQISINNWRCGDVLGGTDGQQYRIIDHVLAELGFEHRLIVLEALDEEEHLKPEFVRAIVAFSAEGPKKKDFIYCAEHYSRGKVCVTRICTSVDDAKRYAELKVSRIVFRSKDSLEVGSVKSKSDVSQACIFENTGSTIF
jgi:hypothetical protein